MNKIKKLIEYFLYFFAFIITLQTRWIIKPGELNNGYFEYGTISLYATDILIIIILLIFIIHRIVIARSKATKQSRGYDLNEIASSRNFGTRNDNIIWFNFALLEFFIFVSIFFAPDKTLAIFKYLNFLLAIGLFWVLIKAEYNHLKLIYCFLAGIFLQAILGIWQFLSQSTFSNKWLGLAEHTSSLGGTSVIETLNGERWLRSYGGLDHPNMLGGVLAIGIILSIFIILTRKSGELGIWNNDSGITKKTLIPYSLFIILITALFFSFSRGAILSLSVSLLSIVIFYIIKNDWVPLKKLLKLFFLSVIIFIILFFQYKDLVQTRANGEARLEVKSTEERIDSYKYAFSITKKYPFFGVGIGNYTVALFKEIKPIRPSYFYQPVHNFFLLIWAEIGIVGFLLLIIFIIYIIILNFKPARSPACLAEGLIILNYNDSQKKYVSILNLSLILAIIFIMLFDHWLWSLHFGIIFLWFVMGIIYKKVCKERENIIEKI